VSSMQVPGRSIPSRILIISSCFALVWVLVARSLGPSDLWDQTQPRTVSYTTDIIVNGGSHWILPFERDVRPATKPPLYNWLAVPAVRLLGFDSEIAHKLPSIAALCLCWLLVMRLGRAIDIKSGGALGWLAGLCLVTNYGVFKLGFLARPDMVLTTWLLLAWMLGTSVIVKPVASGWRAAGFWLCIALAGLTKGPAAIVGVVSIVLTARIVGGSWSHVRTLRPIAGAFFCMLIIGCWGFGVWRIDSDHLMGRLWFQEFFGRISGTGEEGRGYHGPLDYLLSLSYQSLYFLTRFFPWSLPSIAAILMIGRRKREGDHAEFPSLSATHDWMRSAMIFVIVTVGLYSVSVGKRADYIAVAFPQAALLAAWWMLHASRGVLWQRLAPATALVTLIVLTVHNQLELVPAPKGFGDEILRFAQEANQRIAAEPLPVVHCWSGETHLLALMGAAREGGRDRLMETVKLKQPFWLVSGRKGTQPEDVGEWLEQVRPVTAEPVLRTTVMPQEHGWLRQVTLFRVTPQ